MNHFADSLLTSLLSWMRSLFNALIGSVQGSGGGFLTWMKNRWFVLAVFLCLLGIALDVFVYLLRWKPQTVWRSHLAAFRRRDSRAEAEFSRGYEAGLAGFDFVDTPIDGLTAMQPEAVEALDALEPPLSPAQEAFDISRLPGAEEEGMQRRRRSARHSHRRRRIRIRLPELNDGEEGVYVPPVRASEAFHEPIYPAMGEPGQEDPVDV